MLKLAGNTIRNVSRGVVGIALVQSFLAGLGFLVACVPAAGFFSIALVLGIIQIGPAILFIPIVVWSWTAMEASNALVFTTYYLAALLTGTNTWPLSGSAATEWEPRAETAALARRLKWFDAASRCCGR
jgi:predicted PurR-regulated permease PerM